MEYASRIMLILLAGLILVGITGGQQKLQHLVLSESRKQGLEGTQLQVNCTANVTSPLDSLKWIPGNDGQSDIQQVYLTNTTVVMTISSLHGSDAGRYKCLLVMADGREEIAEFVLMVLRKDATVACGITQFKCRKTKHCIFLRYRCDCKDDCGDGSDEECEIDPSLNKFKCNNTRCVDSQDVCNHVDNCGDLSDEGPSCFIGRFVSTTQPNTEDNHFGWLKITVSTVIASTVGVVILISFIVIVVFRLKMKRLREQRIARALNSMYRHGESREATSSGQGEEPPSDQRPFLPPASHHYGNIIVNVNNGVQYLPGYDYSLFLAVPPPYSECGGADAGDLKSQPPPYSTIDRNTMNRRTFLASHTDSHPSRQMVSVSSVQTCLGGGGRGHDNFKAVHDRNCYTVDGVCSQTRSDLGTLPGITPSFLQSLLGSHCDGTSSLFSGAEAGALTETGTAWPGKSHDSSSQQREITTLCQADSCFEASVSPNINRCRPVSGNTQTPYLPNLTSDSTEHSLGVTSNLGPGTRVSSIHEAECLKSHTQRMPASYAAPPDMSIIVHQVPHDGGSFSKGEDVCHASSSYMEVYSVSPLPEPTMIEELSDVRDPLLGREEVSDQICMTSKQRDRSESVGEYPDVWQPLLPPRTESSEKVGLVLVNKTTSRSDRGEDQSGFMLELNPGSPSGQIPQFYSVSSGSDHGQGMDTQDYPMIKDFTCFDTSHLPVAEKNTKNMTDFSDLATNTQSLAQSSSMSDYNPEVVANSSRFSRELSARDGHLVLQIPKCAPSSQIDCSSEVTSNIPETKKRFSGELNIKDGCLVLEAPKHTPSSQILSHLQEVYAAEQRDTADDNVEPIVNTKRATAVLARPSLPKFNSDIVLPPRNQPL